MVNSGIQDIGASMLFLTDEGSVAVDTERWEAVVSGDVGARSAFVYAVKTTGVYCRPGCASRRPNRQNVLFFDYAADAEREGFRPCKRCQPDQPVSKPPVASKREMAIREACRRIDTAEREPSLTELAGSAGISRLHFQLVFQARTRPSPQHDAT